jgi:hypothetical protein
MTHHLASSAVQDAVVAIAVLVAFAYAGVKLMPASLRRSLAGKGATFARRVGASDVFARRVEAKLATGGACGSCDSCKACATPAEPDPSLPTFEAPTRFETSRRRIPIRRV